MKVRSFFTSQGLQRKCLETTFFLRHYRSSPSTSPNGGSPNHGTAQIMIFSCYHACYANALYLMNNLSDRINCISHVSFSSSIAHERSSCASRS